MTKRIIIAGTRTFNDYLYLEKVTNKCLIDLGIVAYDNITIISGKAKGADALGELYAKQTGCALKEFPANWDAYGKSAGYRRNSEMADNADVLIAFWDGASRGTGHMIDIAKDKGLDVFVVDYITNTREYIKGSGLDILGAENGKGRLICCGVPDIGKYRKADIRLFAVRSLGKVKPNETVSAGQKILDAYKMTHAIPLSPSTELFFNMLDWKKKGEKNWFGDLYTPRFIDEMRNDAQFQKWIKRVMLRLDEGKDVLLACWCHSPLECHRSIIAYFMQQKGYQVVLK